MVDLGTLAGDKTKIVGVQNGCRRPTRVRARGVALKKAALSMSELRSSIVYVKDRHICHL